MSVYKRGSKGVFYMNFTVNGKRVFRSTGKFTKREAKLVEASEKKKILNESQLTPQEKGARTLLLDAIQETYDAKWKDGKDSMRSYRRAINLSDIIGNVPLSQITEEAVSKLIKALEKKKSSVATVNRYLASLKTILKHKKQSTDHIKLKKERNGRIRTVSKEEESTVVERLRQAPEGNKRSYYPEVGDLVEVLVDTGMRLSEALSIKYEDINFTAGLISIWINKGDRPRSLPMTRRVRDILTRRQLGESSRVFTIKDHQAQSAWTWVRKQMGLEDDKQFVLHALRHTCASRLVNKGIDLYVVKEWLGHSTIQVTEKYAHLAPAKLALATKALEEG